MFIFFTDTEWKWKVCINHRSAFVNEDMSWGDEGREKVMETREGEQLQSKMKHLQIKTCLPCLARCFSSAGRFSPQALHWFQDKNAKWCFSVLFTDHFTCSKWSFLHCVVFSLVSESYVRAKNRFVIVSHCSLTQKTTGPDHQNSKTTYSRTYVYTVCPSGITLEIIGCALKPWKHRIMILCCVLLFATCWIMFITLISSLHEQKTFISLLTKGIYWSRLLISRGHGCIIRFRSPLITVFPLSLRLSMFVVTTVLDKII